MASNAAEIAAPFTWRSLHRQHDLWLVLLIVAVVALMVLPLPPFMLDTLIACNLSLSLIVLMVGLYIESPLGLSTFPSLLLFTTLLRLSLNIASTRQILLHADAGHIIFTFGNMVVGGDIIVGIVVFLIIAIVQFVVIAKGSERVAEVGARFTLDAMPGKQMSIDSDLRAGIIDKEEAKARRGRLERESHLYGAMDGAMKFVKGDAIAGMIIAAINILAGMAIGTIRRGLDLDHALRTYSVLAVGDALVSQIPSLLVSIAAGIIITRVADPHRETGSSLGNEIAGQIKAHPRALLIGGALIFSLLFVPGFPKLQFLLLAIVIAALGYALLPSRRRYARAGDTPIPAMGREQSTIAPRWLDPTDHALTVPVCVQIFSAAEEHLAPARMQEELAKVRRSINVDLGVPFPGILMQPSDALAEGHYRICINEVPIGDGEIKIGHVLARCPSDELDRAGIPWNSAMGAAARMGYWVSNEHAHQLAETRLPVLSLERVLGEHLGTVLQHECSEFMGIQETQLLLKRLAAEHPDLERELQRAVPLPRLTEVLRRLVGERISIRNLRAIAHSLIDWAPREKDTVMLTEYVRTSLFKYISFRFARGAQTLAAVVLHPTLEEHLRKSIRQTAAGSMLMLDPSATSQLTKQIVSAVSKSSRHDAGTPPVLLTSLELRPYIRKLTELELRDVPVLSYQELEPTLKVTPLASVTL
ncbi:MAG TPA: type III secretion system export apparatus subunit SctV [Steroidobacteraceae bacterium]|nr:type III secretion system export apparatus subunit SctV [Steroidobacteraceae bacterium]